MQKPQCSPHPTHLSPTLSRAPSGHQRFNWMMFNDFHITPTLPEEVGELYGGQKLPCLLYYAQVIPGGSEVWGVQCAGDGGALRWRRCKRAAISKP